MIKQSAIGLDSRIEANPCNEHGFLPIITSPMNSVVDDKTYNNFLKNKIQVCLPRNYNPEPTGLVSSVVYDNVVFESYSLNDFIKLFIKTDQGMRNGVDSQYTVTKVCIDTANGNMPKLHTAIYSAKKTYNNKLVIMAGNVSSIEAFIELAKTGVDYIRVGIGGGGACTTTVHTGVGQEDLEELIKKCNSCRKRHQQRFHFSIHEDLSKRTQLSKEDQEISFNIMTTSIVADGISSFIQQENLHRNGYAAINRLLHAGADLVMIGTIFAKALDSAGETMIKHKTNEPVFAEQLFHEDDYDSECYAFMKEGEVYKTYRGMSTREEQRTYRPASRNLIIEDTHGRLEQMYNPMFDDVKIYSLDDFYKTPTIQAPTDKQIYKYSTILDRGWLVVGDMSDDGNWKIASKPIKYSENHYIYSITPTVNNPEDHILKVGEVFKTIKPEPTVKVRPSEGKTITLPVEYTIKEWVEGCDDNRHDDFPGFVNALRSAMSYTGSKTLNEFKK